MGSYFQYEDFYYANGCNEDTRASSGDVLYASRPLLEAKPGLSQPCKLDRNLLSLSKQV